MANKNNKAVSGGGTGLLPVCTLAGGRLATRLTGRPARRAAGCFFFLFCAESPQLILALTDTSQHQVQTLVWALSMWRCGAAPRRHRLPSLISHQQPPYWLRRRRPAAVPRAWRVWMSGFPSSHALCKPSTSSVHSL